MAEYTEPTALSALDLSSHDYEDGDIDPLRTKFNALSDALQASHGNVKDFGDEVITALSQLSDAIDSQLEYPNEVFSSQANLIGNHGSFILDCEMGTNFSNDNDFTVADFSKIFTNYNSGDFGAMTEVARVPRFSSTYGGSEPAVNATGQAFVTAMNPASPLYLNPFSVAEFTSGNGTALQGFAGTYAFFGIAVAHLVSPSNHRLTVAFWIRPTSAPVYVQGNAADSILQNYIDGVRLDHFSGEATDPDMHKINVGQVAHVCMTYDPDFGGTTNYLSLIHI